MDKIKELIKKLHAEGKSVSEIALEVAKLQEAKALADDAAKLADTIKTEIKAINVAEQIEKSEKADAAKSALKTEVEETVKQVLKSMPAVEHVEAKTVKAFDHVSKKMVEKKEMSDELKAFAEMLGCLSVKNHRRAKEIEKNLASSKEASLKQLGFDIKAPLYSDAVTGSYLIPTEVEAEIFQRAYASVMLPLLNTKTVVYDGKIYPVVSNFDLEFIADETTEIGDKTPTIANPAVDMCRIGGMTYASNTLLGMKGTQLVNAFIVGFGDALARFVDLYTVAGSVTGNSDGFNGLVFDANADKTTVAASTLANIDKADFNALKNVLGPKFRAGAIFLANSKIRDAYGDLNDQAGNPLFRDFVSNGVIRPYGKEFVENPYIPSTFDIAGGKRTTGTDDVVICMNGEGIVTGFDNLVIASSEHFLFSKDQTAWRGVARMGQKILSSSATQGACVAIKKITA